MTRERASTLLWILIRLVLPWAAAMDMLIRRWGKENVAEAICVPFVIVFHLYLSSSDRPWIPSSLQPKGFRMLVGGWHLLDGLSLLALFYFEFTTAMVAEQGGANWWSTFLVVAAIYLFPYATLTVLARYLLWKANRLVDRVVADLDMARQNQIQDT
jgi:hypothetical protein